MARGDSGALVHAIEGAVKDAFLLLLAGSATDKELPAILAKPCITVSIDGGELKRCEEEIGAPFLPSLLLLFSGLAVLDRFDFDFDVLGSYRDEAAQMEVPRELVPIGRRRAPGRKREWWICIERGAASPALVDYDAEEGLIANTRPLATWLEELLAEHEVLTRGDAPIPSRESRMALEKWARRTTLEVRVRAGEGKTSHALYRVRHSKFGEGVVTREEAAGDDTKLEIDFGAGGVRTLLARFVERVS